MPEAVFTPPTLTPAGERLAVAADHLFFTHGVRAVGVDTIAETAGVTKKTLYDRFGSKDQLVAVFLVRRARRWQDALEEGLAQHGPGAERVLAVFDLVQAWMAESDRGCTFVNVYAEVGGTEHPAVEIIRAEKAWMRERFLELVTEAGVASPDRVALTLQLLYEGSLSLVGAGGRGDAIADARDAAARLLDQAA